MGPVSAEEMVVKLRQSLDTLLRWAEAYEPRTLSERLIYDRDLDEAENVLDAVDAWMAINPDRWHTPPET